MGPLEATKPWSMDGVSGVRGFLDRAWRMILDDRADDVQLNAAVCDDPLSTEQNRVLHKTIKAVTEDIDRLGFNTAIVVSAPSLADGISRACLVNGTLAAIGFLVVLFFVGGKLDRERLAGLRHHHRAHG